MGSVGLGKGAATGNRSSRRSRCSRKNAQPKKVRHMNSSGNRGDTPLEKSRARWKKRAPQGEAVKVPPARESKGGSRTGRRKGSASRRNQRTSAHPPRH